MSGLMPPPSVPTVPAAAEHVCRVAWAATAGIATPRSRSRSLRGHRRARTRATGRLTLDDSGLPVLVPPDPGPLSSRRQSPERPVAASLCLPLPFPSRPEKTEEGRSARGCRGSRRRRATRSPRAPFPDAGLPRSDASSAEVYPMLTDLSPRTKWGRGSGRRRIHGRRHFVRRGGARLCVMVEESDPPLGNPRR